MAGNPTFMQQAIDLATENVSAGRGGPFGALIVRDGAVVATGANLVTATNDPTAHAEVTAIRNACAVLGTFQLPGCEIYTSCEPCPMCLAAIYWAHLDRIFFGNTRQHAAETGFDDSFLYDEIPRPLDERRIPIEPLLTEQANTSFAAWLQSPYRIHY